MLHKVKCQGLTLMPYKDKRKRNEHDRWRYSERKKVGLCRKCGKFPSIRGFVLCTSCLWKRKEQSAKEYKNPSHREKHIIAKAIREKRLFLERKCIFCGSPLLEEETRHCVNCLISCDKRQIRGVLKYETSE